MKSWKIRQASARANIARRDAVSEIRRRYFALLEEGYSPEEAGRLAQEPPAVPEPQVDGNAGTGDAKKSEQAVKTEAENSGAAETPPGYRVESYARGWFRVVRTSDGKVVNDKALREAEAIALAQNLVKGVQA